MEFIVKNRMWLETENGMFLGSGRVRLLILLEETGSISQAAKTMGMSYKKAWKLIESINRSCNQPIVEKNVGGKNGGGSGLTEFGKMMLTDFQDFENRCQQLVNLEWEKFNQQKTK